jgi:hypothetical protein
LHRGVGILQRGQCKQQVIFRGSAGLIAFPYLHNRLFVLCYPIPGLFVKIIYRLFNGDVSFAYINIRIKLLGRYRTPLSGRDVDRYAIIGKLEDS